ncbi:hypothetical protein PsorP6_016084 [Peronosclerospora sorghi]|uniref:Uncharacterized protein n=1 Tax=Peronosclerospora sorghi TaxID=230839 RepID=A0ACC0WQD9_9STRA|nr:hypothetical protein PsorP6_016084 [Peronosclerospora sorghi]
MQDEVVTRVTKVGKIYIMESTTDESARSGQVMEQVPKSVDIDIWHARLGHLPMSKMKTLKECVNGFKLPKQDIIEMTMNYTSVKPFPKSKYGQVKTDKPLQIIHSDVIGPVETKSQGGSRFVVTFIDDYSRYTGLFSDS